MQFALLCCKWLGLAAAVNAAAVAFAKSMDDRWSFSSSSLVGLPKQTVALLHLHHADCASKHAKKNLLWEGKGFVYCVNSPSIRSIRDCSSIHSHSQANAIAIFDAN